MATTIAAAFNQFAAWQRTTPAETDAARRHRSSLYRRLVNEFAVKTFFRTGSFGAGTNVPKYSDVDYFAAIPELTFNHNSAKVLAIVAANLRQRFSRTNIRVDSPGISIPFGWDRSEHTEIVPVIEDGATRSGHRQFWIPDGY
ncbi:MAG: hypothetical protein JF570_06220, partial [Caulobacter sp.]|nr:hypothetical protein [Caulobacter sp.]